MKGFVLWLQKLVRNFKIYRQDICFLDFYKIFWSAKCYFTKWVITSFVIGINAPNFSQRCLLVLAPRISFFKKFYLQMAILQTRILFSFLVCKLLTTGRKNLKFCKMCILYLQMLVQNFIKLCYVDLEILRFFWFSAVFYSGL